MASTLATPVAGATPAAPPPPPPQFAGTGPQGHRRRMRERILERGADTLADYELLEVLLFMAIPRRDTKPLAKDAINRLGSLAAVLEAPHAVLRTVPGMTRECAAVFKLVRAAAARMALADARERPLLNTWDRLVAYLDGAGASGAPMRVLYLDGRNRLLGDEAWETALAAPPPRAAGADGPPPPPPPHQEVLGRALDLHATALLTLRDAPVPEKRAAMAADAALAERLRAMGAHVSVVLHDHLLGGTGRWTSLRRQGLL